MGKVPPSVAISSGAKRNLGTEPSSRTEPAAPDNRRRHAAEAGDFRLKPRLHRTRNRKFESISLQQTVRLSRDFSLRYRKAGSCRGVRGARPGGTAGRDAQGRQHHANCR